jgi:glucose-6-phosphate isomerase, archaeal
MEIPAASTNEPIRPGEIVESPVWLQWATGGIAGCALSQSSKTLKDLASIFADSAAHAAMEPDREIYRVQWWAPVTPGSEGGLFWGVTVLQPGKVGDEYFMTRGHFHANPTRAEFYATVSGSGMLIRMDADRNTWGEAMAPGTLHYVRGVHAHRVSNIGSEPLIFWACWGSDAGYDYGTVAERGFSARLVERNGQPLFIPAER